MTYCIISTCDSQWAVYN